MIQNKSYILATLLAVCCTLTAQAGLVNYWTFDADGTDAVTGNSGTFIGDAAVTTTAGEPYIGSGALKVAHNTSDDYFDVAYKVVPDHSIYTITGWYKWDTSFSANTVDDRAFLYETTPEWSSGLGIYNNEFVPAFWANATPTSIGAHKFGSAINDDTWHFFAVTYDSANDTTSYYHDGQLDSTTGASVIAIPTDGIHIGAYRGGGGRNWQGYIDDFAVYEGVIDAAGINALYTGAATPQTVAVDESNLPDFIPDGNLVAHWTFDSDFNSSVNSSYFVSTPQGNTDTATYTSIDTTGVAARGTGALKLDSGSESGNGTFVKVDGSIFNTERDKQIAISSWFRCEDISGDGSDSRNSIYETSPSYSLSLGVRDGAESSWCQWFTNTDTATNNGLEADGPVVEWGQWYHVVTNYDLEAGLMQLYCNGELLYEGAVDGDSFDFSNGFNIGNHRTGDGTRDFDGYIDDVAIFHGVLSANGVAGLYDGTFCPSNVPVYQDLASVPEPSTFVLLASLIGVMIWFKRR